MWPFNFTFFHAPSVLPSGLLHLPTLLAPARPSTINFKGAPLSGTMPWSAPPCRERTWSKGKRGKFPGP